MLSDIEIALGVGVHMVKLAVALAYDGFPDKKLGGDCPGHLAGVLRVIGHP